jgi:hypothetical protein
MSALFSPSGDDDNEDEEVTELMLQDCHIAPQFNGNGFSTFLQDNLRLFVRCKERKKNTQEEKTS